jgi:hypothetical protein
MDRKAMSSGRPFRWGALVDQLDGPAEPAVAQLEVVVADLVGFPLGVVIGLEGLVLVVAEQPPQDDRLVGEAELVIIEPGGVPEQVGRLLVFLHALLDELDPLLDPLVLVLRRVPLDRDIVGQVPSLVGPDGEEVGLELGDQVDRRGQPVPVVGALVLVGADPEQVGDDAAEPAQQEQLHHEAARIDLADGGLAEVAILLLLGQPVPVGEHRPEEGDDQHAVEELLLEVGQGIHAATSRFFRMKYPARENGRA